MENWIVDESKGKGNIKFKDLILTVVFLVGLTLALSFIFRSIPGIERVTGIIGERINEELGYKDLVKMTLISWSLIVPSWILSLYWFRKFRERKYGL